jgi:ribosomal protein S27E
MTTDEYALDGNVAGGVLSQIFAFDATVARITCAGCGMGSVLAEAVVYASAMGTIVRCRGCGSAMIRIAHIPQRFWIDFAGTRMLQT